MDIRETLESTMTEGEKIAALSEKLLENQVKALDTLQRNGFADLSSV